MWNVVMDGPHVPTKKITGSEELELKLRTEWTVAEVKKVQINFRAINTLHYTLNPTKFKWISTCKTAKEKWDSWKLLLKGQHKSKSQRLHSSPTNIKCNLVSIALLGKVNVKVTLSMIKLLW